MPAKKTGDPHTPGAPHSWWVRLARPLVRDFPGGFVQLGKEMSKAVNRPGGRAYTHAPLSRFVATGHCSFEIANAISAYFRLPCPAFVARSRNEAVEFQAIADKYENVVVSEIDAEIIELEERVAELRAQKEQEERAKHVPPKPSKHHAKHGAARH